MSNALRVFLDANVVLEIVQQRAHAAEAMELVRSHQGQMCISALTVHLVMYFGLKVVSVQALQDLLSDYQVAALEPSDVAWAFGNMVNQDFEDALQLAVATRERCEVFYTFDADLHKRYRSLPYIRVVLLGGSGTNVS